VDAIPRDVSQLLCIAIRKVNGGKWYTFTGVQCWICMKFSNGDQSKIFLSRQEGDRGCKFVNKRYNELHFWLTTHPSPKS